MALGHNFCLLSNVQHHFCFKSQLFVKPSTLIVLTQQRIPNAFSKIFECETRQTTKDYKNSIPSRSFMECNMLAQLFLSLEDRRETNCSWGTRVIVCHSILIGNLCKKCMMASAVSRNIIK